MFGELQHYLDFPSSHVAPRQVDVWLPPGYRAMTTQHFPVVYMQDGQNLFTPETSFLGVDWGIDDAMQRLIIEHRIDLVA